MAYSNPHLRHAQAQAQSQVHSTATTTRYEFDIRTRLRSKSRVALRMDNVVLRGCSLKNISGGTGGINDRVYGLCIYAGHETRCMMNAGRPEDQKGGLRKPSFLDDWVNKLVVMALLLDLCVCAM